MQYVVPSSLPFSKVANLTPPVMQPTSAVGGAVLHADALASVPRALTALVYQHRSLRSARRFVEKFFLSREVDLRSMIKFRDPKQTLLATVEKYGRERPVSRYVLSDVVTYHVAPRMSPNGCLLRVISERYCCCSARSS